MPPRHTPRTAVSNGTASHCAAVPLAVCSASDSRRNAEEGATPAMQHADLEAAVDAALDRIGAMMGAHAGEDVAGVVQQPGLAFAGLDVASDEVLDVAARVTRAYLEGVDLGFGADHAAAANGIRGAFLTGYLVGRLHEPGDAHGRAMLMSRTAHSAARELLEALASTDELGLDRRQAAAYNALAELVRTPKWGEFS